MRNPRGNVLQFPHQHTMVRQTGRFAALERSGRVPTNVTRLRPKGEAEPATRADWPTARSDPSFLMWQALYMVLSPTQKDDASRLLRILSHGKLKGFDPAGPGCR